MGLLDVQAYVVTTKKSPVGDPSTTWVNRYDVRRPAGSSTTLGALSAFLDAIIEAERNIHTSRVQFVGATISTFIAEPVASNLAVEAFMTKSYDSVGLNSGSGEGLPIEFCWYVPFDTIVGRSGAKWYRGCLTEGTVNVNDALRGKFASTAVAALQVLVDDLWADLTGAAQVIAAGSTYEVVSHRTDPTDLVRRQITGTSLGRPGLRDIDHKYYDQA